MKHNHSNTAISVGILIASSLSTATGCAMLRPRALQPQARQIATPPTVATPQSADDADTSSLAAVAAFLEQTAEFQLAQNVEPTPASQPQQAAKPPATAPRDDVRNGLLGLSGREADGDPTDRAFANTQVVLEHTEFRGPALALPVVESVSILAEPAMNVSVSPPEPARTTNTALTVGATQPATTLDDVVALLEARAAEAKDFDAEWQLRVTQLALHRDADAAAVSSHLNPETRHILEVLIRAAAAVRSVARDPLFAGERALELIDELRRVIADRADPAISRVALCRKVVTFGVYEPMDDTDFVAGRPAQAIVYIEIRNFQSQETDDGRFRTRLATRLELLTAEGRSVWQREEPEIADVCRRRRTDFFIAQRVTLPPTLPAGDYVLKVLVEDKLSGRADEATHPFTIRSALWTAGNG